MFIYKIYCISYTRWNFLSFFLYLCFRLFVSYPAIASLLHLAHWFFQIRYQEKMSDKVDEMTTSHPLLPYLKAISQEPPSCTLLTNDGGRLQVKSQTGTSCLTPLLFSSYHLPLCPSSQIFSFAGPVAPPLRSQPLPGRPSCTSWTPACHITTMRWNSPKVWIFHLEPFF